MANLSNNFFILLSFKFNYLKFIRALLNNKSGEMTIITMSRHIFQFHNKHRFIDLSAMDVDTEVILHKHCDSNIIQYYTQ